MFSAITNKLEDARNALAEFKRQRRFKKANNARAEAAELQASLATCRGKLEICKNDFNRTIRHASHSIAEGEAIGADTVIQEQMLWDAAIGYMMVKDAIYSLKTIATFDSVTHAYDMLGTAIELMSERQRVLPKLPKLTGRRERSVYGYITSNAAIKQKQELLDGFFEELKKTGDIEQCLANAKSPMEVYASRRNSVAPTNDREAQLDAVFGKKGSAAGEDLDANLDDLFDIHRPDAK